ncbi:RNA-directed DNA polymerase, eukaryota [Tanacetum coccineum]|uniref:RNA-directed DNA polymerase, eukaryota n=1 Tax=Tanacetum coccineum TaxID=301880 RepID=A0ABQ4XJC4_9ASTR
MSPSRRKAWDEIIGKVSNRLSKWKIKTLSVGCNPVGIVFIAVLYGNVLLLFTQVRCPVYYLELYLVRAHSLSAKRSFPRLYALELKKGITVADKLIDASFVASFRRNPRGGVEEEQTFIDDILLPFVVDVTRWVKVVPIKVNILAWKVCWLSSPRGLNFHFRGLIFLYYMPNCGLAGESCSHLFYSCNLARTLWRKIARWWEIDIPDFSCYEEWIAWFKTTRFSKAQKEMLEGGLVMLCGG